MRPSLRWWRFSLLTVVAAGFLWFSSNLFVAAWWQGKYYPGTKVAGQSLGGLTRTQATQRLSQTSLDLTLKRAGENVTVKAEAIGLRYDLDSTLEAVTAARQRHFWPLLELWSPQPEVAYAYRLDRQKLTDFATSIATGEGKAAVDAQVVVENGVTRVVPEQAGYAVNPKQLVAQIESAIGLRQTVVAVKPQTIAADVKATAVEPTVQQAKATMSVPLELVYQDKTFRPTSAEIGSWLKFEKDGKTLKTAVDPAKIKNYVQSLANDIYVAPQNKKVTIQNGVVTEENQGKEGTALDQDHLTQVVTQSLQQRQPLKTSIQTKKVAFKTEYNRTVSLDYGRYIEVNLNLQRLWAYEDHKLVYTSAITSGATAAGFETAKGLFSIYYKTTNTRLRGYQYGWNYDVPVKYWMPFYKGYGLHDASWRGGNFGGQDYYRNGSHGCVNLPDATAAWIYNWASVGTPVWVHR